MKSTSYSDKVLDHFRNPRNVGTLEGPDVAVGRIGNPVCGDLMEIYIKVRNNRIEDIKFKTFGCGSAIATASMISELAKGKTLEEALRITRKDVADELDGLPPIKMHCSNLAADALKDAINNYKEKKQPQSATDKIPECTEGIKNAEAFYGRGVYVNMKDMSRLKDKRTVVLEHGIQSVDLSVKLTEYTPRVVLVTQQKDSSFNTEWKARLEKANVKILFESSILEVSGFKDVEKVRIHDLNEDEEYELFMDALVILM
jgi:FeS cluster assembly scaffold protein NifU